MKIALFLMAASLSFLSSVETFGAELTALSVGGNEVAFEYDGRVRRLIVTTPQGYDRGKVYPVLFCFHGAGGKADGQSIRWSGQADKRGMIVVSAEAVQPQAKWNFKDDFHELEIDDVGFVSKLVERLIALKVADAKSLYATGHSSGGLFCWRLAAETDLFAAVAPMSCGMAKDAHEPGEKTKRIPVFQVIGDKDKSYNGSTNPKITMYSAAERIEIWRKFNGCGVEAKVVEVGEEIVVETYGGKGSVEVVLCKVKDQEHHVRRDLRDTADELAMEFMVGFGGE